jgi:hypothetical protein
MARFLPFTYGATELLTRHGRRAALRHFDARYFPANIQQSVLKLDITGLRIRLPSFKMIEVAARRQRSRFVARSKPDLGEVPLL